MLRRSYLIILALIIVFIVTRADGDLPRLAGECDPRSEAIFTPVL